ncbi:agmatinase [Mesosutterella sp. AGMB02718]|uniref:Agmatinase n=1 Tax=Mesosutterella faecium TaxID=2925194 RepID=A0ABT7IQ68_9BURK|nr:agmatinase [Mesosutterella sp. AGMB02718]MDL2060535.1 agmatinase [Mesosutterella sp. AGMB02718]
MPKKIHNLPITGIASFAKYPICTDLDQLDADVCVMGIPYDQSTPYLTGSKFGPRRIREVSCHYGRGDEGFWDPERQEQYLAAPVRVVDGGDVDIHPMDFHETFDNITETVRKILSKGALPVMMGGDHSVTYPEARAFDQFEDLCIVQFDAHLDFGQRTYTNGSPMRLISQLPHFKKMCQIGMRGLGSNTREDFQAAYDFGSVVIPARQALEMGAAEVIKKIPQAKNYFVTIDIDGYDMSTAPGVGSPSPGGLNYVFETDVLEGIAKKGNVVGFDLVEVAPQYDPTGITPRLGAMTMLAFMGFIMKEKEKKGLLKHRS